MANKSQQSWEEENRELKARLAAAEEHLALVQARSEQLLREQRRQSGLVGSLVATVSELARISNCQIVAESDGSVQRLSLSPCVPGQHPPKGLPQEAATPRQKPATPSLFIPAPPLQSTLPLGLLFPDGGEHYLGMMAGARDIPIVMDMFKRAAPIVGFNVSKVCAEGPKADLGEGSEVLTYIASLASVEKLRRDHGEAAPCMRAMAGLGVGQYSALAAAGVISFEDGLELVKLRWDATMEVARSAKHASANVVGLDRAKVAGLCSIAAKREGSGASCQISGEYCETLFSVGGTEKSILELKELAETAGAVKAHLQALPYAYHTPLLKPAEEKVNRLLDQVLPRMKRPRTIVYMSTTATPFGPGTDPKDIVEALKMEVTSTAEWATTIKAMIGRNGITKFYAAGPGDRLKSHLRHIDPKLGRNMTNVEL